MKMEHVRQRAGVTEKYVPGAGATALLRNSRVGCAALVTPAPAYEPSRKYLSRMPDRSAPDTNKIDCRSSSYLETIFAASPKIFSQTERSMTMSKFKIDHGASHIRQAKIQASIDQSIADDIQLMAEWSNNEPKYIINQLLRFALAQEEDFQKYKASSMASAIQSAVNSKAAPTSIKAVSQPAAKPDMTVSTAANRA